MMSCTLLGVFAATYLITISTHRPGPLDLHEYAIADVHRRTQNPHARWIRVGGRDGSARAVVDGV